MKTPTPFTPKLGRLLIVDDEVELLDILRKALLKQGYEVMDFTSGKEAIEVLKGAQNFDVLLTDLMMPEMDGISLIRSSLELDPNIISIIMTGQGTIHTAVEAMKIGAFDYVLKPFDMTVLIPILSRAMNVHQLKMENIQLKETTAIYELSQALAFTLDLNTILNKVTDAAQQQVEADEVSIMLPTEEGNELYVAVIRGSHREHILGHRVSVNKGIAGWVARHHETLTLSGEVKDPQFDPISPRSDIISSISIPLIASGKLVGVLNVNATRRRHSLTLGQTKALNLLASIAASAIESAGLYERLRESEELFRLISENIVDLISVLGLDGKRLYNNPAYEGILGDPKLLRGTYSFNEIHPEDQEKIKRIFQETVAMGVGQRAEFRFVGKDGTIYYMESQGSVIRDKKGKASKVVVVSRNITERKQAEKKLQESFEKLRKMMNDTVRTISMTVEMRDPYTAGHQRRVAKLAAEIAKEMGLTEDQIEGIPISGLLHDIGKISVPSEILSKPGKISEAEFTIIKSHAQVGYEILKGIEFPWPVAQVALQHHERLNSSGYPLGISGKEMLLESKVMAVADVVEAMSSHRPYRPALGTAKALEEVSKNKDILYDAEAVKSCLKVFEKGFRFE